MQKTKIALAITALALVAAVLVGIALVAAQPLGTYGTTSPVSQAPCNGTCTQNCYQYNQAQNFGYCQGANQNCQFRMGMGFGGCHR